PEQEEMAYAWAKKKDTPYVKDPVFISNFLNDFLALFPEEFRDAKIEDIDFSELYKVVEEEKLAKESMSKEEKKMLAAERKKVREKMKEMYGWAEVDGNKFEVANWMVEPPGLFMGRGEHPLRGKWKPRVRASDIVLNLSEDAPVPEGEWKEIVHDHESMWLAKWIDKLTKKEKYVWLSDTAKLRQDRDKAKYDKARELGKQIDKVVKRIYKSMHSKDRKERMIATVCYLIYKLAMRVGDEKDPDEADTVGASTLRVEHVKLNKDSIEFDFLGKDSVRWHKSIKIDKENRILYENLKEFMKGKKEGELIFSDITSRNVNRFLGKIVKGLTAKVFRTYLASDVVTRYLATIDKELTTSEYAKIYHAKMANLQAAVTCNHKRAPPKNFEKSLEKKKTKLEEIEKKLEELKKTEVKTEKQKERLEKRLAKMKERLEKTKFQIELALNTRDYNLNTSLRNYIDPRIFKAWCDYEGIDWTKLYSASLQRKFQWINRSSFKWERLAKEGYK
ncbi:MAG: DNA topoisomerase I, partial [Candidatus Nitrosothermus koennekii]